MNTLTKPFTLAQLKLIVEAITCSYDAEVTKNCITATIGHDITEEQISNVQIYLAMKGYKTDLKCPHDTFILNFTFIK